VDWGYAVSIRESIHTSWEDQARTKERGLPNQDVYDREIVGQKYEGVNVVECRHDK
jgi:hypothetical protein